MKHTKLGDAEKASPLKPLANNPSEDLDEAAPRKRKVKKIIAKEADVEHALKPLQNVAGSNSSFDLHPLEPKSDKT